MDADSVIVRVPEKWRYRRATLSGYVGVTSPYTVYTSEGPFTYPENRGEELVCDTVHLDSYCDDCDVRRMSRLTLGQVEDQYHAARVDQDQYEAYAYVWTALSTSRTGHIPAPTIPAVRRIARKLFAAKGFEIPTDLKGESNGN